MILFFVVFAVIAVAVFIFVRQPKFGKAPSGERLQRILKSPNFRDGAFQNISHTPALTEGTSYVALLADFFFRKKARNFPVGKIPSVKTDLKSLSLNDDVLIWLGHSSYYLQVDGQRMLIDPVISGRASPLPFGIKAFNGTDIYTPDDFPEIDLLFITHDHWDHLDYSTITRLKPKVRQVICGLGVGEHLEYWGYDRDLIVECDWNDVVDLGGGFTIHTTSARHFSGRSFKRNQSLWMSYVLITPTMKIFIGGDSGYDKHFAEIGNKYGPFDLAILENGQYDKNWRYIHIMPDEILTAAKEVRARRILPVHSAKFTLANHPWDEPLKLISENSESTDVNIITPMIGEQVNLKDADQRFSKWWETVDGETP